MFTYVAGVGLMEKKEFDALLYVTKRSGGHIQLPPYYESDLPLDRVRPFTAEQDAVAVEFMTEALVAWVREQGCAGRAQKLMGEAREVGTKVSRLLALKGEVS